MHFLRDHTCLPATKLETYLPSLRSRRASLPSVRYSLCPSTGWPCWVNLHFPHCELNPCVVTHLLTWPGVEQLCWRCHTTGTFPPTLYEIIRRLMWCKTIVWDLSYDGHSIGCWPATGNGYSRHFDRPVSWLTSKWHCLHHCWVRTSEYLERIDWLSCWTQTTTRFFQGAGIISYTGKLKWVSVT